MEIEEFDVVRIVALVGTAESHLAISDPKRPPAIGDEGTVLELPAMVYGGRKRGFIVESTEAGAEGSAWLAEFSRDELELVFRAPRKPAPVAPALTIPRDDRTWRAHRFVAIAAVFALACLASAAMNRLEAAGWLFLVMAGALVLAGVQRTYRNLPADRKGALLSQVFVRRSAVAALLAAILVSSFYWFFGWLPLDLPRSVYVFMAPWFSKLDFIPAVFSLLLPVGWRSGFHQYFRDGLTYCFPGAFGWEAMRWFRVAIPGYFTVFMAVLIGVRFVRFAVGRRDVG
jgi:hypothetical protein